MKNYEIEHRGFPQVIDEDSKCFLDYEEPVIAVRAGTPDVNVAEIANQEGFVLSGVTIRNEEGKDFHFCKPVIVNIDAPN